MAIAGFAHRRGHHCGSTSLRDLAAFYGWDCEEPTCFGLGSGLGFTYVENERSPSRVFVGRTPWLETAFLDALGVGYDDRSGEDWASAWGHVEARLRAGDPVLLFVDLYHLDYYGTDTHFGPHTVVAVGTDGETVLLADSEFDDVQSIPLGSLRAAWSSDEGFWGPLRNRSVVVTDPEPTRSVEDAARSALRRTASAMLDPGTPAVITPSRRRRVDGLAGIRVLAAGLPDWGTLPDAAWCARFGYQNVERRGTGGGAFRGLYAPFVRTTADRLPELDASFAERMTAIAADWTAVGETLKAASEAAADGHGATDARERDRLLALAGEQADAVADRETAFFEDLTGALE